MPTTFSGSNVKFTEDEAKSVVACAKANNYDNLRMSGAKFGGLKHMFLNEADGLLTFKAGKLGALAYKTNKLLIVGVIDSDDKSVNQCAGPLGKLADALKKKNF